MPEKEAEDIVSRLEALRKRVPEEAGKPVEAPAAAPPAPDKKKRFARIIGIFVILLVIGAAVYTVMNFVYLPMKEKEETALLAKQAEEEAFIKAKSEKLKEINEPFAGLSLKYATAKETLLDELNKATTVSQIRAIDPITSANERWRAYRNDQVEALRPAENIKLEFDSKIYRGYDKVKEIIAQFTYVELRRVTIDKYYKEYFPIRLSREQAAGGWAEPGNYVNIWFYSANATASLAKDAKVIAIMRGKESGEISMTQEESKVASGSGAEGKGALSEISIPTSSGGISSVSVPGAGSAGYKTAFAQTSFEVDIAEVQKVVASGKLSEDDIEEKLLKYGYELNKIESTMGIGDFDVEYLILFEVSEEEVPALLAKASPTSTERDNVFVTISKSPVLIGAAN